MGINSRSYVRVACEPQTHFRSSLLSLRSDDRKCVCGSQATFRVVLFKWERKQIFSLSLKLFLNTTWQIPTNVNKNNHHSKETRNSVGDQKFFVEKIPS